MITHTSAAHVSELGAAIECMWSRLVIVLKAEALIFPGRSLMLVEVGGTIFHWPRIRRKGRTKIHTGSESRLQTQPVSPIRLCSKSLSKGSARIFGQALIESMQIRIATSHDADEIRAVHLSAFPQGEGEVISKLAVDLLVEETAPSTVSLVAEVDGVTVGHVAFSPVVFDRIKEFQGYILAPLAVRPDYQKRCIGSQLVQSGIQRMSDMGVSILFVYGDPKYYGRFGFSVEAAEGYVPPYALRYPFGWQGIVLRNRDEQRSPVRISCVTSLSDPALW